MADPILKVNESQIDWKLYDLSKAREIAKRFGSATILDMAHNLQSLDLVDKGNLLKSLKASPRQSIKGYIDRVEVRYEWYGKFFELGAENVFGKGVRIMPTPWRKPAIEKNIDSLSEEMTAFYAEIIMKNIESEDLTTKLEH